MLCDSSPSDESQLLHDVRPGQAALTAGVRHGVDGVCRSEEIPEVIVVLLGSAHL